MSALVYLSPPAARFLARNRFSIPIAFCIASAFAYAYQAELRPPALSAIKTEIIQATAIGAVHVQVLGTRENTAVASRDAGYGIEYAYPNAPSSTFPLPPVWKLFSSELELTPGEIDWIKGHGPNYRIGLLQDRVVFIESMKQPLVRYERYVENAMRSRFYWQVLAGFAALLAPAFYLLGRALHARTDA